MAASMIMTAELEGGNMVVDREVGDGGLVAQASMMDGLNRGRQGGAETMGVMVPRRRLEWCSAQQRRWPPRFRRWLDGRQLLGDGAQWMAGDEEGGDRSDGKEAGGVLGCGSHGRRKQRRWPAWGLGGWFGLASMERMGRGTKKMVLLVEMGEMKVEGSLAGSHREQRPAILGNEKEEWRPVGGAERSATADGGSEQPVVGKKPAMGKKPTVGKMGSGTSDGGAG